MSSPVGRKKTLEEKKDMKKRVEKPKFSGGTRKKGGGAAAEKEKEDEENLRPWEQRLYETRKFGQLLRKTGGVAPPAVKGLVSTLRDGRCSSEGALRRSAIEALVPASLIGHRGALEMQAKALTDPSDSIRKVAVQALRSAAGDKRPTPGGAVAVALAEVIPPPTSRFDVQARTSGAASLIDLAPRGDAHMLTTATKWLKDAEGDVRLAATKAMGEIGISEDDVTAVAAQLRDKDWRVSQAAVLSLENLADLITKEEGGVPGLPKQTRRTSVAAGGRRRSSVVSFGRRGSTSTASAADEGAAASAFNAMSPPGSASKLAGIVEGDRHGGSVSFQRQTSFGSSLGDNASAAAAAAASGGRRGSMSLGRRMSIVRGSVLDPSSFGGGPLGIPVRRPGVASAAVMELAVACGGSVHLDEPCCLHGLARREGVSALGRIALPGDPEAIESLAERLGDGDEDVRRKATKAIKKIATGDVDAAVDFVGPKLADFDYRVRAAAREAIGGAITFSEDGGMLDRLMDMLEAEDWRSRRGVAPGIMQLLQKNDADEAEVMQRLYPKLMHEDWSIRRKAAECLQAVARGKGGSREVVRLLGSLIMDPDEEVRIAMARCVPAAAPKRCKEAIAILTPLAVGDDAVEVRMTAVSSIMELAREGRSRSRTAIQAIASCLEDDEEQVREAAVNALQTIGYGRRSAIDMAAARLGHKKEEVRRAAVRAFGGVLGNSGEDRRKRAFARTMEHLVAPHPGVREAAAAAIAEFSKVPTPAPAEVAASALFSAMGATKTKTPAGSVKDAGSEADDESARAPSIKAPIYNDPDVLQAAASAVARFCPRLRGPRGGDLTPPEPPEEEGELDSAASSVGSTRGSMQVAGGERPRSALSDSSQKGSSASVRLPGKRLTTDALKRAQSVPGQPALSSGRDGPRSSGSGPNDGEIRFAPTTELGRIEEEEPVDESGEAFSESSTDEDDVPGEEAEDDESSQASAPMRGRKSMMGKRQSVMPVNRKSVR
eukprot:TRINITY_DN20327_c0_g1_i1.p1 TRINITY_DN20327_c0_g1~~TRINITY_DN20327_c0_g1_i1.p1  ORF type:complete len:1002 (-),score=223.19 TRINITY_DN20327_c0_g1_i1:67-3072(-)